MAGKNKGGREIRKPKKAKAPKSADSSGATKTEPVKKLK